MAIKRYIANSDNTITNAFKQNLSTRGTGSNMGSSDILEVFSIYGQSTTSSAELARTLVKFPVSSISTDRTSGAIPASGSVKFYLKIHNAPHGQTVPESFNLSVLAISRSWSEGRGVDMEEYSDADVSNWIKSDSSTSWTSPGGDYHASPIINQSFDTGTEDLEVEVTPIVEEWIAGTKQNYGFGIRLANSNEAYVSNSSGQNSGSSVHNTGGATSSYYTKKFFGRGSHHFFKRPTIEVRWDSSERDERNFFYQSSSLLSSDDNLNTLYIYNRFRGQLKNIAPVGTGNIFVSLYSGSTGPIGARLPLQNAVTVVTGGYVSKGIYSASVASATTSSYVYDVWHNDQGTQFVTGSKILVREFETDVQNGTNDYVTSITNLKRKYSQNEDARIRLFVRQRNWNPTIYTVATTNIQSEVVEDAYYKIVRTVDDYEVVGYGTGSLNHTRLSYDKAGNYFDLDMSMLEKGYSYQIKFVYKINERYDEQAESFKFRVE